MIFDNVSLLLYRSYPSLPVLENNRCPKAMIREACVDAQQGGFSFMKVTIYRYFCNQPFANSLHTVGFRQSILYFGKLLSIMIGSYQLFEPPALINRVINRLDIFASGQPGQLFSIYCVILLPRFADPFVDLWICNN